MNVITRVALGRKVNTLVYTLDDAINLHQGMCGLEDG